MTNLEMANKLISTNGKYYYPLHCTECPIYVIVTKKDVLCSPDLALEVAKEIILMNKIIENNKPEDINIVSFI